MRCLPHSHTSLNAVKGHPDSEPGVEPPSEAWCAADRNERACRRPLCHTAPCRREFAGGWVGGWVGRVKKAKLVHLACAAHASVRASALQKDRGYIEKHDRDVARDKFGCETSFLRTYDHCPVLGDSRGTESHLQHVQRHDVWALSATKTKIAIFGGPRRWSPYTPAAQTGSGNARRPGPGVSLRQPFKARWLRTSRNSASTAASVFLPKFALSSSGPAGVEVRHHGFVDGGAHAASGTGQSDEQEESFTVFPVSPPRPLCHQMFCSRPIKPPALGAGVELDVVRGAGARSSRRPSSLAATPPPQPLERGGRSARIVQRRQRHTRAAKFCGLHKWREWKRSARC